MAVHLTFSFWTYRPFATKHASILSIHSLMAVLNSSFRMHPKIVWVSWITCVSVSKFQPHSSHFNDKNYQNLERTFNRVIISTFDFLISCKILWGNIVRSKHPFFVYMLTYCLETHHFHVLTNHVFFFNPK